MFVEGFLHLCWHSDRGPRIRYDPATCRASPRREREILKPDEFSSHDRPVSHVWEAATLWKFGPLKPILATPPEPPGPPGTPSLTRFQPLERIKDYPIMREPSNAHIASNSFSASIPPYKLLILLMRYGMTFRVRLSRLIDEDRSAHVGWTAGTSPALGP